MSDPTLGDPTLGDPTLGDPTLGDPMRGDPMRGGPTLGGPTAPRYGGPPDRIELHGLRVRGFHGVFGFERRDGQDFVVDAVLETSTRAAAGSDDLRDTVDYGGLAQSLAEAVAGEPVDLIETLAERLAGVCLADPRVSAATITVHKPQAPIELSFSDVRVTIRRERP